uniref:EGF-like domain-containing protein n=1 Tax=Branchiostoma floridae TaxID=7739 RepID=C3YIU0_BRAFL|eukprot:XP_002603803.1 hypothetical protein BRAFLDRAFT_86634 [Branchiostoma floridae]
MAHSEALVLLLLVSNYVLFVHVAAPMCPKNCLGYDENNDGDIEYCRCPNEHGTGAPCGWVGHGGIYSYPVCLDAIPTDFAKQTPSIYIERLRSSTLKERSFPSIPRLRQLKIERSNISEIQRGAFRGLPLVQSLMLDDNRISSLEPDAFLGLEKLTVLVLNKNMLSVLPQHVFRGLPLMFSLTLENNLLRSVPVDALLQPMALRGVNLRYNRITVIDSDVMTLQQNQRLRVLIGNIKVRCDKWFICNHQSLYHLSFHPVMTCASPADLNGIRPINIKKDICQSTTYRSQQYTAFTTGVTAYNKTTVIEAYTEVPFSEHTTQRDYIVILGGHLMINNADNSTYISAMINAVVVPLLLVSVVLLIFTFCCGTDLTHNNVPTGTDGETSAGDHNIQPYAVAYADSSELQGSDSAAGKRSTSAGAEGNAPDDNCTIQPYAAAYAEDPGSEIQPYAVAYDEETGP